MNIYVFKPDSSLQAGLVKEFPEGRFETGNRVSYWQIVHAILQWTQKEYERLLELAGPITPKQDLEVGCIEIYDELWEQSKVDILRPLNNAEYDIGKRYIYQHIQDHLVLATDTNSV